MNIRYISYGLYETGGFRHEQTLYEALVRYMGKTDKPDAEAIRFKRLFTGPFAWFRLVLLSFLNAGADINIVPARMALGAMLRNLRSGQVWIVMHNYDENDGKSVVLKWYYKLLFVALRKTNHGRYKVICVAPYWENYFRETCGLPEVFLFPNLFDVSKYRPYAGNDKNAWIHMGQYGPKNDPASFELAERLSAQGYYCFFSTLNPSEVREGKGKYDILYFLDFEGYLDQMSRCCCTLALSTVKEGWNRIAHESILVGTPVIGYGNAGLGDLLKESHSIVVNNPEEAYTCITGSVWVLPGDEFIMKYDTGRSDGYLKEICRI